MKIYIKNMVCDRCKLAVQNVLDDLGWKEKFIHLGEVELVDDEISEEQLIQFKDRIERLGFELINDKKSRLIENIKKRVIKYVQPENTPERQNLSKILSSQLYHDYTYLSNLFSSVEGITIEQYCINQRIEKTRELLVYDELTLTEIAYSLGYSSVAHLSRQFKKVTGFTPTEFRKIQGSTTRNALDKV